MATASTIERATRFKHRARHRFDVWAGSYDRSLLNYFLFRPAYLLMMEEIAAWRLRRRAGRFRLLDVGCGTGTFLSVLARSGWPVDAVGLDYSPSMCVAAKHKARSSTHDTGVRVVTGDSEHLPFAPARFDVITCANSFHHYPHQDAVIHEMRRVLKPGGRLILVDGFRDNVIGWFVFDVIVARLEGDVHHAPWTRIDRAFHHAGFERIRRRKTNVLLPLLATIGDAPEPHPA